jgi:NTP pyrophosphatase (non-canonical NTP hydrolase)
MTLDEYRKHTTRTLPDLGKEHAINVISIDGTVSDSMRIELKTITVKLNLAHMALGLSGEIGELVRCVGTELKFTGVDRVNLGEELGDIYWYLANYCNMRDLPLPESLSISERDEDCLELLITSIGDLVDIVKRFVAYNKAIEKPKELDAIYNICVSLKLLETTYKLDGSTIREKNINKLRIRYPEKFSDELAVNRDTDKERKTLE